MGNANVTGFLSALADTTGRPIYNFQNAPATFISDVGAQVTGIVEGRPYIEVPFATDILMHGDRYVLVKGAAGLGNRVLALLTALLYARLARRAVVGEPGKPGV